MSTAEHHPVFTYGSLLSERVLQALLGRVPHRQRATLPGYTRHPLRTECYPVILKTPPPLNKTASVKGMLLLDITTPELALLDKFEDARYDRAWELVQVDRVDAHATPRAVETVRARVWARACGDVHDVETGRDWSEKHFREVDEEWYVRRCVEWAAVHSVE